MRSAPSSAARSPASSACPPDGTRARPLVAREPRSHPADRQSCATTAIMSVPRFYCLAALAAGRTLPLPPDTFHHAVRVRRLRVGDALVLFAGDGSEAVAKLVTIRRDAAEVAID